MSLSSLSNALPPTPSPTDKVDHGIPDKPDRHSHHRKHLGPYDLLETLGMGEFGKVRLAVHRETGQQVAVKVVKKRDVETASRRDKIDREISVLNILRHPHIIKLLEVIETESSIGIIMQYAEGGELFEYLYKRRRLGENEAKRLFAQLISSVHYMHEKKIVHRDLKLENLLLDKDLNIIVSDFGFANQLSHNDDLLITSCGSPCYAAPELVVNDGSLYSGFPVDVWSCGVILYAMVCGFLPFDDDPSNPNSENINLLYRYILSTSLTFPDWVSPQLQELLRDMLAPMPQHRSSLESILVHPWLEDYWYLFKKSPQQLEEEAEATIQSLKVPHEPNPSAVQEPLPTLSHEIEKANNQPTMEATLGGLDTVQEKSEKSGSTFDPTDTGNQKPPPSAVHISATSPPPSTSVRKSRLYNMLHHKRSANRASYHSENDADYNDQTHPNNKDSARRQKKAGTLKTKFLTGIRGICSPQPLMERKQENRGTWRTSKSFRLMKRKSPVSLEQTFSSQGSDSPVDFTIPMTPVDRSFANCDHPDGPPKSFTCEEKKEVSSSMIMIHPVASTESNHLVSTESNLLVSTASTRPVSTEPHPPGSTESKRPVSSDSGRPATDPIAFITDKMNRMSTAPDSISIHDGTVDPASLTCRPPGDVFVDLLHTLRLLGVTVHCDESFRLVCIRRESRTFQIRSPVLEPSTSSMASSAYLTHTSDATEESLPSLIFSVNADPSMDPVYGDPSFDHGEEVRFMMEICRFRHLADLYLVDSRLMRGPDPVYQFLRTKILGLLRLSKA